MTIPRPPTIDRRTLLAVALATGLLASAVITPASATDPGDFNGLTPETALSLFSLDHDTADDPKLGLYQQLVGRNNDTVAFFRSGDVEYDKPPQHAATWTTNAFASLSSKTRPADTAIYPSSADRKQGRYIKDAHTTIFAITPSTIAHIGGREPVRYVAPNGSVRALLDYRVRKPEGTTQSGNTSTTWEVESTRHSDIRLLADGEVVTTAQSQTAVLRYDDLPTDTETLSVEATIRVQLSKTVRTTSTGPSGEKNTTTSETTVEETVTVRDELPVSVYTLGTVQGELAGAPGTTGESQTLAITADQPFNGYRVGRQDGRTDATVRTHWRFYTARRPAWDTIYRETDGGTVPLRTTSVPVVVHAYPSTEGVQSGPTSLPGTNRNVRAEGPQTSPPTLPDTIQVDVRNTTYSRHRTLIGDHTELATTRPIRVDGIVAGVNQTVRWEALANKPVHDTRLSASIDQQSDGETTLRIRLVDADTGEPIQTTGTSGKITVNTDGSPVVVNTNAAGYARVTVDSLGGFSIEYQPQSWQSVEDGPAYQPSSTFVRIAPVDSPRDLLAGIIDVALYLSPILFAVWYANRVASTILPTDRSQHR